MRRVRKAKDNELDNTYGTYWQGDLHGVTYGQLLELYGTPQFNEASGDDKVQFEWVFYVGDEVVTLYDWKTYDRNYSMYELDEWHVGGKSLSAADEFIEYTNKVIRG